MLKPGNVVSMQTRAPVAIESHALGTLKFIRASIESAGSQVVSGMAGISMGMLGVLAAIIASIPELQARWLEIWVSCAAIAFAVGGALMVRQSILRGRSLHRGPARKFLLCLGPTLLAGAVLTYVLWQAGASRLIPGTWLLLYGCAVVAASTTTSAATFRVIGTMGALFVVLGLATFLAPPNLHTLLLGVGFGGFHLIAGALIGRSEVGGTDHGE